MRTSTVMIIVGLLVSGAASQASAAEEALWLRYPAISPDGETIAFSYRGDLWTVASDGGIAVPLTTSGAHETMPVWSPDGALIAFASDRHGNFDVYVMPAAGGDARRLTFHSAGDETTSFTPDGAAVLFSSSRLDDVEHVGFPTGAQPELYRVAIDGGRPGQVLTTPAEHAVWAPDSHALAYSDVKGYETEWRKHDDSSFARDVWLWEHDSGDHVRLTDFGHDDRQPALL